MLFKERCGLLLQIQNCYNDLVICKDSSSGSGLYSGGLTWSIVPRCDDHTGIFTCNGCARDPYFYVPAEAQTFLLKESPCRQRGLNSAPLGYNDLESATLSTAPARHIRCASHGSDCLQNCYFILLVV